MRRLLNPPRDPISTPAALERAAALRSPRTASPVSLVPDCVAVAESALDRSLAVLVSRALDHCSNETPPPPTPPSTKGDAFARAVAEADAAVAPHARSLEACAARRFARRFLGDSYRHASGERERRLGGRAARGGAAPGLQVRFTG